VIPGGCKAGPAADAGIRLGATAGWAVLTGDCRRL